MDLKLKPQKTCQYDTVSLGEVMLRLDPGEGRIRTARQFRARTTLGDTTMATKKEVEAIMGGAGARVQR